MATGVDTTISLPGAIAVRARAFAERRNCSLEELADEAIRNFMGIENDADPRIEAARQRAWDLGLTPDEYAVRAVKEVRAEIRAEAAQANNR